MSKLLLATLLAVVFSCTADPVGNVESIVINPGDATLSVGDRQKLEAMPKGSGGKSLEFKPVTWSSSNTAVATVDRDGLVRAVGPGTATITATTEAATATVAITVRTRALRLSTTVMSFTATERDTNTPPQTVTFSGAVGGWTAASSQPWLTVSPASGTGDGTLTLTVSVSGLSPGDYSANISISPLDASFAPTDIPVTLSVALLPPKISLSRNTVPITGTAGGPNPEAQTVEVSNSGGGTLSWTAQAAEAWLTVSAGSGTGNGQIRLSANLSGLVANTYTATVTVSASGASNTPQNITVTLTVNPAAAVIVLSRDAVTLTGVRGGSTSSAELVTITNGGAGALNWSVASDVPWLSVDPPNGVAGASVTLRASLAGMSVGNYPAKVTISAVGASTQQKTIAVTLVVTEPAKPQCLLQVSSPSRQFTGNIGEPNPTSQTFDITNSCGSWTLASTETWLTAAPTSGNGPQTITVTVDLARLAAANHTGRITISAAGADNSPLPVTVTFSLGVPPCNLSLSTRSGNFSGVAGGTNPPSQTFDIMNSCGAWSLSSSQSWLTATPGEGSTAGPVTLNVNLAGLTVGRHPGTITVTAPGASNGPQTVAVTLDVAQPPCTLSADTTARIFIANTGDPPPPAQTFNITNGCNDWSTSSNQPWLTASPSKGTAPASITLSVNPAGMAVGKYPARLSVTAPSSTNSGIGVTVTLEVINTPRIVVTPESWIVDAYVGETPQRDFTIMNTGGDTLNWTAKSSAGWLYVKPASGRGNNQGGSFTALVDSMPAGTYSATITFEDPKARNSVIVPVTVNLLRRPQISITPDSIFIDGFIGGKPEERSLGLTNAGGGTLVWEATSNPSWLTVSPARGTGNTKLVATVNFAGFTTAGPHNGTILVSAVGATNTPQRVYVFVRVSWPPRQVTITTASPVTLTPGQTATIAGSVSGGDTTTIRTVNYTSSNPAVASVNAETGRVTAVSVGTTTVSVRSAAYPTLPAATIQVNVIR